MIDIITVVRSIGNRILFLTPCPRLIWHLSFCGSDQDNRCMWEWSEGSAPRQENRTITCVSLRSDCGFCKSSFKWHIKTGFVVYPVSSQFIHSFFLKAFQMQMRMQANLFYKDDEVSYFDISFSRASLSTADVIAECFFVHVECREVIGFDRFGSSFPIESRAINKGFQKLNWLLVMCYSFSWSKIFHQPTRSRPFII